MDAGLLAYFLASDVGTRILFINAAETSGTSVAMPSHQTGDMILGFGVRHQDGGVGLPSGWTSIFSTTSAHSNLSCRLGYKVAASASETSGTWTNADTVGVAIFRNVASIGANNPNTGVSSPIVYDALSLTVGTGTSVALAFGCARGASTSFSASVPGMLPMWIGALNGAYRTAQGVSSFASRNQSANNNNYISITVELVSI